MQPHCASRSAFQPSHAHSRSSVARLRLLLLTCVLLLQLFALTQHHHDLASQTDDCPSCVLTGHFSSGGSLALPAIPTSYLVLLHIVAPILPATTLLVLSRYLFPLPLPPPSSRLRKSKATI